MYRRHDLGHNRVEVGVRESRPDILLNPVVWRRIGNIDIVCLAGTAGDDATIGVSDNRPGIPRSGEIAVHVAVRVDGYPRGPRVNAIVIVVGWRSSSSLTMSRSYGRPSYGYSKEARDSA